MVSFITSGFVLKLPFIKESDLSIALLALYPITAAAFIWGKWTSKRIRFLSDNIATVFIVHCGRYKSIQIIKLVQTLSWTTAVNNFHFTYPEYIIRQPTVCCGFFSRSSKNVRKRQTHIHNSAQHQLRYLRYSKLEQYSISNLG